VGGGEVMGGGGFWILGSLEVERRRKRGRKCTVLQENGGKGKKNDLKIGHMKV
jgi:hypothetical protein